MNKSISLLITLLMSTAIFSAEPYKASYIEGMPNTLTFENGKFSGAMGSYLKCVLQNSELETQHQADKINNLLDHLALGKIDFATAIVQTAERDQYATATDPLLNLDAMLLSQRPMKLNQIAGEVVSVARGSSYSRKITEMGARIKYAESYIDALQMLMEDQVTAAVIPRALVTANDISEAEKLFSTNFTQDKIVFYVSKRANQPETLVRALNKGINTCHTKN